VASEELARQDDFGLKERQVKALGRLHRLGARPREEGDPYDSDPQIRALQLVYEGRMGGPGLKQGRPRTGVSTTAERQQRAAEVIATEIRERFTTKMIKAIDRALKKDAGVKANLDAVKLALDIENREAALQLRENESDFDTKTKEELLATLFELVNEPQTAAAIEGTSWEITDAEVVSNGDASAAEGAGSNGDTPGPEVNGSDTGGTGSIDRERLAAHRAESANPFTQTAIRRANQR
jgi:hypothetical protein